MRGKVKGQPVKGKGACGGKAEWSHTPFCSLGRIREALERDLASRNAKKARVEKSDEELFSEAMAGVREIREFRDIPVKAPAKSRISPARPDNAIEELRGIVCGDRKIRISDTGEYAEWISPGTRCDIAGRLHRGDFSVQDSIDLHGMTVSEAEEAVCLFLREAVQKRLFCVKVIHGRGLRSPNGPVLKEALKTWLMRGFRKKVLAYATARDCDGGLGATYVLLKQC